MRPSRKGQRSSMPPQREKHLRWVKLRKEGWTFREIAEQEDPPVGATAVHNAVKKLTQEVTREAVGELIAMESERLDSLQRSVWGAATTTGDEEQLLAIDRVVKIMERRAKLFALDGKEAGTSDGESREVPIDELRELLAPLGYRLVKDGDEEDSGE